MISEDTVLKVIMEDAGCERLDKECLENILELVKEGKYPKLSNEELKELDEGLANLVNKVGLRDRELAEKASKVGLEKTSQALQFGLLEEEIKEEGEISMPERREVRVRESARPARTTAPEASPIPIKIKQSKAPAIISLLALILSLGTLALLFGYVSVPGVKIPNLKTLDELSKRIDLLEATLRNLDARVASSMNAINKKLRELEGIVPRLRQT